MAEVTGRMTTFQITAVVLTLTALGSYVNHRLMRLPATIGNMVFALLVSLLAIALDKYGIFHVEKALSFIRQIDFSKILLHGMLSFLLFAGALHIRFNDLRDVKVPVAVLATLGVVMATFITGTLVWLASALVGLPLAYIHALLFGALISPTDPIAVLAMLKQAGVSKTLHAKIGGESLFNDGIGVVVFLTILSISVSARPMSAADVGIMLAREAVGGVALGGLLGWITYRLLRPIDEYNVEVLLTLALVSGGYALGEWMQVSGPICMVVAGLIVGNQGRFFGMSDDTRRHLDIFWELLDEILNAVLFMLIGLEIIIIPITWNTALLGGCAIAAVLTGRLISVALPIGILSLRSYFQRGTIRLLTWGGLRGGLSIAMALSLPEIPAKNIIVPITYLVVLFSVLVQGLTFRKVAESLLEGESNG